MITLPLFYVLSQTRSGLKRKRLIRAKHRFDIWNEFNHYYVGETLLDVWEKPE